MSKQLPCMKCITIFYNVGGGLGGTRRGGPDVNLKHSGREDNERERERYRLEREAAERAPRRDEPRRRSRSREKKRRTRR